MTTIRTLIAAAAALCVGGCTVENASVPPVSGPSEFGLSVTLVATPDQLPRDGSSQAIVSVTVRDANGRPVSGQRLAIAPSVGAVSQSEVVTDGAGRATFAFVAPSASTVGNLATVRVTPVGEDYGNAASRSVTILLTGSSNATAPTADFTVTPSAPQARQTVTFDASATRDEGAVCLDACTYQWDFGDGATGTGRVATHTYSTARTYVVTLTVTDPVGARGTKTQSVSVSAAAAAPTVTLAVAPNPPLVDQPAAFTATATPGTGRSIVRFAWTFGDGTSTTTTMPSVTKTYTTRGTFVVSVTVTDDVGQTASTSLQFTITAAGVTASFTFSPTAPITNDTVRFDGSASTGVGGATIKEWKWDFGDGTTETDTDATTSHRYTAARTYVVRLTVTDTSGRTGTTTRDVAVSDPE